MTLDSLYRKKKVQYAPGRNGKLERKQTGHATAKQYRTRPQLALEMIRIVADWIPLRKLRILGDSEYAGGSISRHLPATSIQPRASRLRAKLTEVSPISTN